MYYVWLGQGQLVGVDVEFFDQVDVLFLVVEVVVGYFVGVVIEYFVGCGVYGVLDVGQVVVDVCGVFDLE